MAFLFRQIVCYSIIRYVLRIKIDLFLRLVVRYFSCSR